MRLQRILASAGIDARRGAEALIRAGRVRVNGVVAKLGDRADPLHDDIQLDGESIRPERPVYWILHKPRGVLTSTTDPEGRQTVLDLVPEHAARVFPVGRLDRDTEGLLLLTNDGLLANTLLHPSHGVERVYEVVVRGSMSAEKLQQLAEGVRLEDGWTAPARVGRVQRDARSDTTRFLLTLVEGRKRQIRRALSALESPVRELRRVRFGPLQLGALPRGAARRLSVAERRELEAFVARLQRVPRGRVPRGAQGRGSSDAKSRPAQAKRRRRVRSRTKPVSS